MKREIITCDECQKECVDECHYTVFKTSWDGIVQNKEDICKTCFQKMYAALQIKPNHDGMREPEE